MRRTAIATVGVLVVFVLGLHAPALAYQDVYFDPDDRRAVGFDPDIKSTGRTVWRGEDGRRRLRIGFRAYERLGLWWFVTAHLDSLGGKTWDFKMSIWNADLSGKGCVVCPRGHPGQSVDGYFSQRENRATCRVPLRLVTPTKRIRWNLESRTGYGPPGEADFAPDDRSFYG
jgi:hypothetical protein